jgi:diguanylate cyclase (GGDEF)-like protein
VIRVPFYREPNLLRRVLPFVALTLIQTLIATASLDALSNVRAYVGGESLWSKGQKDAIYFLDLYADTGDERYYGKYLEALAAPLGDRSARLALEQKTPDFASAAAGLRQGGNHPDDIPGVISLFVHFRNFIYMRDAVARWRDTDQILSELSSLGESVHADVLDRRLAPDDIRAIKDSIYQLNKRMTPIAVAFSRALGAGSRAIKLILTLVNLATALVLIVLVVWHIRNLLAGRRKAEGALRTEQARAQATLAAVGEAVVRVDAAGCVEYLNPAAERLIGSHARSYRGAPLNSLFTVLDKATGIEPVDLIRAIMSGDNSDGAAKPDLLIQTAARAIPVSLVGTRASNEDGTSGAVLVFHDMTSEQGLIKRLAWQAAHDELTNIANRREFEARLEKMLEGLREHQASHAVVFLDLDQFKVVNDTCGHAAGDELLCQISTLLQRRLRPDDLLARLGGDEFGLLLENRDTEQAAEIAEELRSSVQNATFTWERRAFNITASIGVVCIARPDVAKEEALRAADMACYLAKERGRNRVQIHQSGDTELLQRFGEMAWVQRIHDALERNRFCLYAQTIEPLGDDRETGGHVELLVRMLDDQGHLIPPNNFIPAAERFDLMPLIDRWVVRRAFEILTALREEGAPPPLATCAINISGASVGDPAFANYVRAEFRAHGVPPSMICFEITETGVISNLDRADQFIREFQQLGCRFALDDFGTGMSSFAYLKRLSVDYLKIDGSFVRDMLVDRIDRAMVEMVSRMAKTLGKRTIAEFVESEEILKALREIGVDYAQGYAIGAPKPFTGYAVPTSVREGGATDAGGVGARLPHLQSDAPAADLKAAS